MGKKEEAGVTHVHEIYIKAPAEQIWEAITSPEWTAKYGYRTSAEYELRPGGRAVQRSTPEMRSAGLPEICIDGVVVEAHPPRKLVHTWRFLFSPENEAEGFTRVSWEVVPTREGFCRLTVTHELAGAPLMATATSSKYDGQGGGGWTLILSDLKSLLETGTTLVA